MFLHIIKLAILKDCRCHVGVLDAIISQQRRRKVLPKIHMSKSLGVPPGNLVIAGP